MNSDNDDLDYTTIRAALAELCVGEDPMVGPARVGHLSGHTTAEAYRAMHALVGPPFDFLEEHWLHADTSTKLDADQVAKVFANAPFDLTTAGGLTVTVDNPATECVCCFTFTEVGLRIFGGQGADA